MTLVAGLFKQCRGDGRRMGQQELTDAIGLTLSPEETRREEMRKKEKLERATKAQEKPKKKRTLFDFEKVFFVMISLVIAGSSIC